MLSLGRDVVAFAERLQPVCTRSCSSEYEHQKGWIVGPRDGDDRCVQHCRLPELYAECHRWRHEKQPRRFSNYTTEIALAETPDQLIDRINLLLMACEIDAMLRSQVLSAVNSIAIPSGDQNAINAALANQVKMAIYLAMATSAHSAQF